MSSSLDVELSLPKLCLFERFCCKHCTIWQFFPFSSL
jgi:hypothetical protein